jgi:hypothetical protein
METTDQERLPTRVLEILSENEELFAACIVAARRLVESQKILPSHIEVARDLFGSTLRIYMGEDKREPGKARDETTQP